MATMEQVVLNALSTSPLALVLFWMVWTGNKKLDQKDEQIQNNSNKLESLIENSIRVSGDVISMMKEQNEIAKTLNQRIYDVLTKHTNS